MGYLIYLEEANFKMKGGNNLKKALQAIKDLCKQEEKMSGGSWQGGKCIERYFSWVDTKTLLKAKTFAEAMEEWRYPVDQKDDDIDGDVYDIGFEGEKMGDEEHLFEAIAPFVEKDSWIHMIGEDGAHWNWIFDGKTVKEIAGKIIFEEE